MAKNSKKQKSSVDFTEYSPQGKRKIAKENAKADPSVAKKNLIIIVIVLVVIVGLASITYAILAPTLQTYQLALDPGASIDQEMVDSAGNESEGTSATTSFDTPAPDFPMMAADGNEVSLADFQGRPVVLNFWASTCGPCKRELPAFQAAYEQYGDRIQFIMLDCPDFLGETEERARAFMEESGYDFPLFFDVTTAAQIYYGITSIPQTYLIDASGNIIGYSQGSIDEETLQEGIDLLLGDDGNVEAF